MRGRRVDDAIESVNTERKENMRERLHRDLDLPLEEAQTTSRRKFFNIKSLVFGATGIIAVCLAIVLPLSLKQPQSQPPKDRYSSTSELSHKDLGYTLKEYGELIGKNILYLDWYDVADDIYTEKNFKPEDENDILYIDEDLYYEETGDHVQILVTDVNTHVDLLDHIQEICIYDYEYNGTKILWSNDLMTQSNAFFEYDGYKYYVRVFQALTEETILDTVKEILKNK